MKRFLCWLFGHNWRGRWYDSQRGYNVRCHRCGKDTYIHYPSYL